MLASLGIMVAVFPTLLPLPVDQFIANKPAAHSYCSDWLSFVERGKHLQSELMRKTKVAKPWFRFCCAPYHVPQLPTQPSSNDCLRSVNNNRRVSSWTNNRYKGIIFVVLTMPPDSQQSSCSTDWLSVDKEQRLPSKFVINKQVTSTQSSPFSNPLQIAIHALTIPNKDEGE